MGLAAPTAAHDRFLVGLAVLSLVAVKSDEQPLLCLVDDAQWLDHASLQTLAFMARRLTAEPIAVVFALRDGTRLGELAGLPTLVLRGLEKADAALLARLGGPRAAGRARTRPNRGRGARQPAGVAGVAPWALAGPARRRLRHTGRGAP